MWLAAGVFLCHLIQSAPLSWRYWLVFDYPFLVRPFLIHFLHLRNCYHYLIISLIFPLLAIILRSAWINESCLSDESHLCEQLYLQGIQTLLHISWALVSFPWYRMAQNISLPQWRKDGASVVFLYGKLAIFCSLNLPHKLLQVTHI